MGAPLRKACVDAGDAFKVDSKEVEALTSQSWPVFLKWMKGGNPFKKDFYSKGFAKYEFSVAYEVESYTARECESPNEATHEYPDCDYETELPGTADVIFWRRNEYLCVLDYKTGDDVPEPGESGQLLSLATALLHLYPAKEVILALAHAPRRGEGLATIYADTVSKKRLDAHAEALADAWQRRGTSMSPGEVCRYCPALTSCPTQSSMLVELKRGGAGRLALTPERVGAIHLALQQYKELAERLGEEIRGYVSANGPVTRPDGKVLDFVSREYETLSKSSVTKALGVVEGEKVLAQLRKKGCLVTTERQELRAENDRGK